MPAQLPAQHCPTCAGLHPDREQPTKVASQTEIEGLLTVVVLDCGHEWTFPSAWIDYIQANAKD